ncbi:hypothetical protein FACUT_4838 [Fusarium acutatum]|uniref:Uncharacterized protein n=1 Tax=Fusarium acutatum TaxID=78861 RepID=A0A8H4JX69_9HYPO|nr:hypothetical protein FACUT_4838 [Fusarium acutatum]
MLFDTPSDIHVTITVSFADLITILIPELIDYHAESIELKGQGAKKGDCKVLSTDRSLVAAHSEGGVPFLPSCMEREGRLHSLRTPVFVSRLRDPVVEPEKLCALD